MVLQAHTHGILLLIILHATKSHDITDSSKPTRSLHPQRRNADKANPLSDPIPHAQLRRMIKE